MRIYGKHGFGQIARVKAPESRKKTVLPQRVKTIIGPPAKQRLDRHHLHKKNF
jgi:hypothetical protein